MKQKIILFYKFVPIARVNEVLKWQHQLCEQLGLKGRVLISDDGINGTLGGDESDVNAYIAAMDKHDLFGDVDWKTSHDGNSVFPRLSIKYRQEVVTLKPSEPIDFEQTGTHLEPEDFHELIQQDDVVVFDARNKYESDIGKFEGAITPNIDTFSELPEKFKKDYKDLKGKKLALYCTGGIRCEPLSAMLKQSGFEDVYQLSGGIVRYGEKFGNKGKWKGKMFVFDDRMSVDFGDDVEHVGECRHCGQPGSEYQNCKNSKCNDLMLQCDKCFGVEMTCSETCAGLVTAVRRERFEERRLG